MFKLKKHPTIKYFKNQDELTVQNLTEVIYVSTRLVTRYYNSFPPFQLMIGTNYKEYILNVLILTGLINPSQYSYFMKHGVEDSKTFIHGIAKTLVSEMNIEKAQIVLYENLVASYLSAIIILDNPYLKNYYFRIEMPNIGAIDKSVHSLYNPDAQKRYDFWARGLTAEEQRILQNL